jgi:hypothetical protein
MLADDRRYAAYCIPSAGQRKIAAGSLPAQETRLVAVIEDKWEAGGARCIEFKVQRSPSDPDRILGSWQLAHGDSALVDRSRPDAPVAIEFRVVLDCADQHGIPFVWVNDPDELFPPWERR